MNTSTERLGNLQHRKFENLAPKYNNLRVTPYGKKGLGMTRPLPVAENGGSFRSREEMLKADAKWKEKYAISKKETV